VKDDETTSKPRLRSGNFVIGYGKCRTVPKCWILYSNDCRGVDEGFSGERSGLHRGLFETCSIGTIS
jgi:hypothetical protein